MRAESVAKSIQMLKGILDGKTYVAIAQESGLSRSAVEQRVKALARDLETVVGVERVDEDDVPTVNAMRARKDNYLEALEHYHPQRVADTGKGPRALKDQDIERAVAVIRQHSNCRKRDTALLLVLLLDRGQALGDRKAPGTRLPDRRRARPRGIGDARRCGHQRQDKATLLRQHQGRRGR